MGGYLTVPDTNKSIYVPKDTQFSRVVCHMRGLRQTQEDGFIMQKIS